MQVGKSRAENGREQPVDLSSRPWSLFAVAPKTVVNNPLISAHARVLCKDREGNRIIAKQQAEIFLLTSQIQNLNDQLDKTREAFEKEEQ